MLSQNEEESEKGSNYIFWKKNEFPLLPPQLTSKKTIESIVDLQKYLNHAKDESEIIRTSAKGANSISRNSAKGSNSILDCFEKITCF